MAALAQGGPVGAEADTYTVDGSLTFVASGYSGSINLFNMAASGNAEQAAWDTREPIAGSGPPFGVPTGAPTGPYGNSNSVTGIVIGDGTEFATAFKMHSIAPEDNIGHVYVDLTGGSITVKRYLAYTMAPLSTFAGTLTLQSSLYEGATSVTANGRSLTRLEDVLADSFELEDTQVNMLAHQAAAAAAAPPKKKSATGPAPPKAKQPARATANLQASVTDSANGIITITFPQTSWNIAGFGVVSQDFTVVSGVYVCGCA